ncbi:SgcJ/EcaC family oxidoreductase, partial [Kocuria sp. CPCC 205268]|uniref:SgcJ/EcaC family oxidoreductase n=1 Tax=Kocuria oxytropis TaxID=3058913 RepID=UPI0034D60FDA
MHGCFAGGHRHRLAAAWNDADAGSLAELFAEDADFVNVVVLWWRTRIQDDHAYGLRRMFPQTVMTLGEVACRELGRDVAVVHTARVLTGQITPAGEPAGDRSVVLSFTVSRRPEGRWLAVCRDAVQTEHPRKTGPSQMSMGRRLPPRPVAAGGEQGA